MRRVGEGDPLGRVCGKECISCPRGGVKMDDWTSQGTSPPELCAREPSHQAERNIPFVSTMSSKTGGAKGPRCPDVLEGASDREGLKRPAGGDRKGGEP